MTNRPLILTVLTIAILAISAVAFAQNSTTVEQISTFDTRVGELASDDAVNIYMIDVDESQIINLNILSLTGALIPEFKVFDAQGSQLPIIQDTFDNQGSTRIVFPQAGQYRLEISSGSQSAGEYIVSTKMIRPYTPNSIFIPDNTQLSDSFSDEDLLHRYWFSTEPEQGSTIIVYGEDFAPGIVATIRNLRTSEDVGVINTPAMASVYCLPAGVDNYAVDIMQDTGYDLDSYNITITSGPTSFCDEQAILALADSLPTFSASELSDNLINNVTDLASDDLVSDGVVTDVLSTVTDGLDDIVGIIPDAVCGATPYGGSNNINMRTLPSVAASVTAVVETSENLAIIGQTRQQSWLQVRLLDGRTGFASASVLDLASLCAEVDIPFIWTDEAQLLRLELEAGILDIADVNADLLVGMEGIALNVDGTVASIAGLDVNGTINDDGITLDANVDTGVGVNVDAGVNVGDGGVDVNADVNVGDGVDVDADVNIGDGGINVDVDVNDDPIVDVDIDDGGIDIDILGDDDDDDDDGINIGIGGININLGG